MMLAAVCVGATVQAQRSAPVAPSQQPPPDDGVRARLVELANTLKPSPSAPEVAHIEALIREAEPLSAVVYSLPRAPTDAVELLNAAYVNGSEIGKELLNLPRIQQAVILQQAALWVQEYRELPKNENIDVPAMLALLPPPGRQEARNPTTPKPSSAEAHLSPAEASLRAQRARLLELLELGENEMPSWNGSELGLPRKLVYAYPQSGPEMVALLDALRGDEAQLLATVATGRRLALSPVNSPTLQRSGVAEPVTLIPSRIPTDPEELIYTAYGSTSTERLALYRSSNAAVRGAMRRAARRRLGEAMQNEAAQVAEREAARKAGRKPPVQPDPRIVFPEIIIIPGEPIR